MRENAIKAKMLRGEAVIGPFIPMPSPMAMELTAMAGMDFGIIDCEHGFIDYESVYPMTLAAEARGMTAIARCPVRDPQFILRYLDLGVQGLHVPQINTKQEAEDFVQACRYQPRGWRGSASPRASDYGLSGMSMYDAMQHLNREVLTIAHIENPRAVDNLEEICTVEGLDVLFVGRGDMSHALGVPNQFDHPSVREQMARVVAKSKGSDKILGTVVRDAAQAKEAIEMGFRYIACGFAGFLVGGMKQFLADTKG
jgi:4-hydroxy-2-oxoheptanedioate aldolase